MGKYIVKRILQVIPMLFILSLIVFMMVRLIPGDPVDMMLGMDIPKDTKEYERERLGLNDPLYIQYFRFVGNALHGDLGTSIFSGKPVVEELAKRFPKTLTLAVGGTLFGAAVGVLLGIIAAIHRNKFADNLIMVLSLLTVSTPSFFLALILMLIFCLNLRWLPSIGMDTWQGAVLPIATLGLQAIGSIARTTRSAMLDVIHQDYIRTSRSRGVPERVITYRHAFKNALIPVLTTIGLRFGGLLAGATLVETVFSIPGIGRFVVDSVSNRDYPAIQGAVLVLAVVRAMSRNCQKRYEENMKFERAFGGIGRKFSFWKRKFADRKTHVYIKCGVCKKTLRLPKVKGEHTVKCPNCANKFKVKI